MKRQRKERNASPPVSVWTPGSLLPLTRVCPRTVRMLGNHVARRKARCRTLMSARSASLTRTCNVVRSYKHGYKSNSARVLLCSTPSKIIIRACPNKCVTSAASWACGNLRAARAARG
eukprot:7388612-Prymnesium_polylepis.1